MTKHSNYKSTAVVTIKKVKFGDDDCYELSYDDDQWSLSASKDEILEELSEHLELMRTAK